MAKASQNSRAVADFYAQKAKRDGYPARSVYKLEEIDKKWNLIGRGAHILDVGAAPGSWSLYTLKKIGSDGFLCSVDLKPMAIKATSNCLFLQGDAFSDKIITELSSYGLYDGVICDAAPHTTGNRLVDSSASTNLVEQVIELSVKVVKEEGFLVVKIFQGGEEKRLVNLIEEFYHQCKKLKPKACRSDSFESYLIGLKHK